jgi:hypothetical protein
MCGDNSSNAPPFIPSREVTDYIVVNLRWDAEKTEEALA